MRRKRGQLKKLGRQARIERERRDKRKPPQAQRKIRLWAHRHIKGEN